MKRRGTNKTRDRKSFSRNANKTHKRNLVIPRGGFRL